MIRLPIPLRIGPGYGIRADDYRMPGSSEPPKILRLRSAWRTRVRFLEEIDRLASHVRADLLQAVRPAYDRSLAMLRAEGRLEWDPTELPLPIQPGLSYNECGDANALHVDRWYWERVAANDSAVEPLRQALEAWADQHFLNTRWVIDAALVTIAASAMGVRTSGEYQWHLSTLDPNEGREADEIVVQLPSVTGLQQWTRHDFREEVLADVRAAIERHFDRIERIAKMEGLPTVATYDPDKDAAHIEWLVRRQVLGHSVGSISRDAGVSWQAVNEVLRRLLRYLQLPKRDSAQGGRPSATP